eukprot:9943074-Prorocentrum_lima.AAC.1
MSAVQKETPFVMCQIVKTEPVPTTYATDPSSVRLPLPPPKAHLLRPSSFPNVAPQVSPTPMVRRPQSVAASDLLEE